MMVYDGCQLQSYLRKNYSLIKMYKPQHILLTICECNEGIAKDFISHGLYSVSTHKKIRVSNSSE